MKPKTLLTILAILLATYCYSQSMLTFQLNTWKNNSDMQEQLRNDFKNRLFEHYQIMLFDEGIQQGMNSLGNLDTQEKIEYYMESLRTDTGFIRFKGWYFKNGVLCSEFTIFVNIETLYTRVIFDGI